MTIRGVRSWTAIPHRLRRQNPTAAQHTLVSVEHNRLAGSDTHLRFVEADSDSVVIVVLDVGWRTRMLVANLSQAGESAGDLVNQPVDTIGLQSGSRQIVLPSCCPSNTSSCLFVSTSSNPGWAVETATGANGRSSPTMRRQTG